MADNDSVLAAAAEWKGAPMALATVVSTWGSAPRPRGSHMLVHADGRFEGSVSGGCVEGEILDTAAKVIAGAPFSVQKYGVADDSAWQVGLPCGGEIAVMVQPVTAEGFDPELFDRIAEAREAGRALTVTTDLATGHSDLRPVETGEVFANRYDPPRRLLIVGAVQIAQSLAALAATLGIETVVIDPRGRFLTEERFPGVTLDDRWPDEAVAAWNPGPSTAVVTLSHDTKIDDPALVAALASVAPYVGALGSRKSHAARLERLAAMGVTPEQLARIDGPVGIDIGAIGPSEIALSIAAAMIGAFHSTSAKVRA
jgi:xanthine dehydrogenase accessory factor